MVYNVSAVQELCPADILFCFFGDVMSKKSNRNALINLAAGAVTAALYVVLTLLAAAFGLSGGVVQVRFSEALTVLPVFFPGAVWGLFAGCIISNILTGCMLWDVVFGSLATLAGAVGTYYIGKKHPYLSVLPPIIANTAVVPLVLKYVYHLDGALWFFVLTVAAGEIISCGALGLLLLKALKKLNLPFMKK